MSHACHRSLFPYYFPFNFPIISLLGPLLFAYYVPIISLLFPYYVPTVSPLFPYYFLISSSFYGNPYFFDGGPPTFYALTPKF